MIPLHVSNEFVFDVDAPMETAAPLFGPEMERVWAGASWDPRFIHPQPAQDIQGAVFTIERGDLSSVWVNTLFDVRSGRMQYVYFVPGKLVTIINVSLTSIDAGLTRVRVVYDRTALVVEANEKVRQLGEQDRSSGPEWAREISDYLQSAVK